MPGSSSTTRIVRVAISVGLGVGGWRLGGYFAPAPKPPTPSHTTSAASHRCKAAAQGRACWADLARYTNPAHAHLAHGPTPHAHHGSAAVPATPAAPRMRFASSHRST